MSQEDSVRLKIAGASLAVLILVAGVSWYVLSTNSKIENLQSRQSQLRGELTATQTELGATSNELSSTKIELSSTKQELASTQTDLASTKRNLTSTRESLAATQGDLLSTQVDLTTTRTDLASTQTELSATKEELATTATSLSDTQRDLSSTQQNLAATRSSLEATQDDLSSTKKDLASTKGDLATTRSNLTSTQGDLASTRTALSGTQEELNSTKTSLESTSRGLSSLRTDLSQTNSRLTTVRADLDEIMDTYGNIDLLNEEVASLETEIAELEAEREPLILETHRSGFACTGSMEPKLTCLDEATWLGNFHASDIVVGTTISFKPTEECNLESERVAHRVAEVKEADGVFYFWPKGDNNRRADRCWIPEENVNAYIIDIHKDVFADTPNAELREFFNKAVEDYRDASDAYRDYCTRHTSVVGRCTLSGFQYSRALALYEELDARWERRQCWGGIIDEWNRPGEMGDPLNRALVLQGQADCDGVGA